jgi:dTDP-4-dehydrorhamnose 3,5-epimerase
MPSHERGIAFDDPALGIDWQVDLKEFILSPKDENNPLLTEAEVFDYNNQEYLR